MRSAPTQHPILRAFLTVIAWLSTIFVLLMVYAMATREAADPARVTLFMMIGIAIAVACFRKLAAPDAGPGTAPDSAGTTEKLEGPVATYEVVYKGGLPEYPQSKPGKIRLDIWTDRFDLVPTAGTQQWFAGLAIPFDAIDDIEIVQRQVSTFEGILGGLDSRQLNQANNIHVAFTNADGRSLLMRLEMLSGITVMGQAEKCLEFEDRLRATGIRGRFRRPAAPTVANAANIPGLIEQLGQLRERGLITASEYDRKKAELLERI